MEIVAARVAHQSRARAVTAICRATIGHEKEDPIGVTMHQTWDRGVAVFAARIGQFPRRGMCFLDAGYHLPSDRTVLVRWINQIEKVGRDRQGKFVIGQSGTGEFLGRQRRHQTLQLLHVGDAVLKLPMPIVPIAGRNIAPKSPAGGAKFLESI